MENTHQNKRYQVFVSSTFKDLKQERSAVIRALLDIKLFPAAMEHFPAADDDPTSYIERLMMSCDYYILILGGKYGSLTKEGISFTQLEYETAMRLGIPMVSFIHSDIHSLPARNVEMDLEKNQKFQSFLELVQSRLCKEWSNPDQLYGRVIAGLSNLIATRERVGWIRGDSPTKEYTDLLLEHKQEKEDYDKLKHEYQLLKKVSPLDVYKDFDEAWPTIEELLIKTIEEQGGKGEKLKVRCMGLCLHKSFPKIKNFFLNVADLSSVRVELRLLVLDSECEVWQKLDGQWQGLLVAFDSQFEDFVRKLKIKENVNLSIKLNKYSHMPNFHGIMINKNDLFLSGCMWDSYGNLTAGQNPYEYYRNGISGHHNHMLKLYSRWFDFSRYQYEKTTFTFDSNAEEKG